MSMTGLNSEWKKRVFAAAARFRWASLALAAGCGKQQPESQPVVQVQAEQVTPQTISQHVTGDAVLAPIAQAAISPKITAPVKKFYVKRGDKVKGPTACRAGQRRSGRRGARQQRQLRAGASSIQHGDEGIDSRRFQTAKLGLDQAKANLDLAQRVYDNRKCSSSRERFPARKWTRPRPA